MDVPIAVNGVKGRPLVPKSQVPASVPGTGAVVGESRFQVWPPFWY